MFQRWARLLFLHWELDDPLVLQRDLPPGLHLDFFEGRRAFVGVVPFFMQRIRPRRLPCVPWLSNFLELNVRTYVHDEHGQQGVWFFSLDTNRWLAQKLGRTLFHLPYEMASMSARIDDATAFVRYACQRRGKDDVAEYRYRAEPGSAYREASPDSLEEFLLERYRLFAWNAQRRQLIKGEVRHDSYEFAPADAPELSAVPLSWNGLDLEYMTSEAPMHACVTRDVDVRVFATQCVDALSATSKERAVVPACG